MKKMVVMPFIDITVNWLWMFNILLKKAVSFVSLRLEKEDQCLMPEAWNVDQGVITKLKEQYKKERKGKKGVKSKWKTLYLSIINLTSFISPNFFFPMFS